MKKTTHAIKKKKYKELTRQIKQMGRTKDLQVVSIVISSTGLVHERLAENLEVMVLGDGILIGRMQKTVIIKTYSMMRMFLGEM